MTHRLTTDTCIWLAVPTYEKECTDHRSTKSTIIAGCDACSK